MSLVISLLVLPQISFAQSVNHMTKVVTVGKDEVLGKEAHEVEAPKLVIELKDGLNKGDRFYLNLEDALWHVKEIVIIDKPSPEAVDQAVKVIGKQIAPTQLEVQVVEGTLASGTKLEIPIYAKVTGTEAKVVIDSNNTTVTGEPLLFAKGSEAKGKVTRMGDVSKVVGKGSMPKLMIEEAYGGQFRQEIEKGAQSSFIIRLDSTDFAFELTKDAKLVGNKGYEGIEASSESLKLINDQQLQVTLPTQLQEVSKTNKGAFIMQGIEIKAVDRHTEKTSVAATISGGLIEEAKLQVLELGQFEVDLVVPKTELALAGTTQKLKFTLKEDMPESILRNRPLVVTVTNGAKMAQTSEGKVAVKLAGKSYQYDAVMENGLCVGFEIPTMSDEALKGLRELDFEVEVQLPVATKGTIEVCIDGSAVPEHKQGALVEVKAPVQVSLEAFEVRSAKRDQVGGSITIKENQAGAINQGENILITMDTTRLELTAPPLVAVVQGDIVLGTPKVVEGGVELPVTSHSTKPSTIVIKHFEMTLDGSVPTGRYQVGVGGQALSKHSVETIDLSKGFEAIDPIASEDFVLVNVGPANRKEITFKLGEEAYAVNGKYHHLDVPAYLEQGRVMVPMKYVAEALGIPEDKVKFNKETEEIVLYANKIIELEIGSNIMKVDGEKIYMKTTTQLLHGRTMVPMAEIARALEIDVKWDNQLETATFVTKG